jgi:hypothetical protein
MTIMMMARLLISLSITLFTCAAHGENFALIMNIGDYQARGVPKLYGVQHDREAARQIARKIGTKDENIFVYKDAELTLEGLRKAFADLNTRLMPGDRVFMYYSGHGARVENKDAPGACSEGLVSVKGELLLDKELEEVLKGMAQKADKVIFFLDACHSGGITTRAGTKPQRYMPKSATIGSPSACRVVTNQLTRSVTRATQSPDSGGKNYVFISAARDSEVALDDPEAGGVATKAWGKCLNGEARDLDNSGAISADEIRTCAQNVIDQELKDVEGYVPHHIMIVGNPYLPLAFPDGSQLPAAAPASGAKPAAAAPAATPTSPVHTLRDIYHQRDDNRAVKFTASRDGFRIGKDKVQFTLNSTYPGYVYILMAGSDNKTLDLLFPNKADQNNYLQANENWTLPRPSWEIEAGGPAGTNHLLVIVADAPRDFSKIITDPAGPFASVDANAKSSKEVLQTSGASVNKLTSTCAKTRNLKVVEKGCSDGFGAAMIEVKEIN